MTKNIPSRKQRIIRSMGRVLCGVALLLGCLWFALSQPSCRRNPRSVQVVHAEILQSHVEVIVNDLGPRNWLHPENLDRVADYIAQHLQTAGAEVSIQSVPADIQPSRNILGSFSPGQTPRIIVGAHYDACYAYPAADDNASGVAVLLGLAELLGKLENPPAVDLIAYALEEPPYFATEKMGSAVHAESLAAQAEDILGVIVLEMVGYYSDEPYSQSYPMPMLYLMYPNRGNFLAVVSRWDQGGWIRKVKEAMKGRTALPVYSIRAPDQLPGIDFSDHRNYWPQQIPALMVTDTAFYRNKAYHSEEDLPERLNYEKMAEVTVSLFEALLDLGTTPSGTGQNPPGPADRAPDAEANGSK